MIFVLFILFIGIPCVKCWIDAANDKKDSIRKGYDFYIDAKGNIRNVSDGKLH